MKILKTQQLQFIPAPSEKLNFPRFELKGGYVELMGKGVKRVIGGREQHHAVNDVIFDKHYGLVDFNLVNLLISCTPEGELVISLCEKPR